MNSKRTLKFCILHFAFCILVLIPLLALAGIKDTKHNLSVSGPGPIKAVQETQICIFCHTPHNANPATPLWNHELSAVTNYVNYHSETLQSYGKDEPAPPIDGYSKLCLSCHDGTIALGSVISRFDEIQMEISACVDASGRLVEGPECGGYIGTNLSGGHPISIIYDMTLVNKRNSIEPPLLCSLNPPPPRTSEVKVYPTQGGYGVQCTSCHNPHINKATGGWPPLWRKDADADHNAHDAVCMVCHVEGCGHAWQW